MTARVGAATSLWSPDAETADGADARNATRLGDVRLDAYEIHMGQMDTGMVRGSTVRSFLVDSADGDGRDGLVSADGCVVGTYLHGLLENGALRRAMVRALAARKGVAPPSMPELTTVGHALDRLANVVAEHLDMPAVAAMAGVDAARLR